VARRAHERFVKVGAAISKRSRAGKITAITIATIGNVSEHDA